MYDYFSMVIACTRTGFMNFAPHRVRVDMAEGFRRLGLADWLCRQVTLVGFKEPADIQKYCIPPILEGMHARAIHVCCTLDNGLICTFAGKDCIGCAKTGSGKTAAFALPILHRLAEDPHGVFALVITPTR